MISNCKQSSPIVPFLSVCLSISSSVSVSHLSIFMSVCLPVFLSIGLSVCRFYFKELLYFNDALNTFYLRLYGDGHMVKVHSDSERGNPLPPHGLLFSIDSKGSFIRYLLICIYAYTHIHTYIHTYVHIYLHTYTHTHIHIYINTYIHTYTHRYTHTYIHTHIRTYIHTYTHTYIHTLIPCASAFTSMYV